MAYARTTFEQLKDQLSERVGGATAFWNDFEKEEAINEALAVWQLLVGEFSTLAFLPMVDEYLTVYDPASGLVNMVDTVDTTVEAPMPLSIKRIQQIRATEVETGGETTLIIDTVKLIQASLPDLDKGIDPAFRTSTATTSTVRYWAPQGINKVIANPLANTTLQVDYYRGNRLLTNNTDYVQLGDEELDRVLGYAVWYLNVKSGTQEAFATTKPLKDMFFLAAKLRNSKLRGSQLYKDFLGADYGENQPQREALPQSGGR